MQPTELDPPASAASGACLQARAANVDRLQAELWQGQACCMPGVCTAARLQAFKVAASPQLHRSNPASDKEYLVDVSSHKTFHQQVADQAGITIDQHLGVPQDEVALQAQIPAASCHHLAAWAGLPYQKRWRT